MPYIKPTNRKFCINSDIADKLLMRQEEFPCEPYDEPYYNPVDKKFQTKIEILHNFWLGCEDQAGCGDAQRETSYPYEAFLGVDKYYLENVFKYPVDPNDLPYNEPQFSYKDLQWVQYKDIYGIQYHFTINNQLSDTWTTHYYKQTNKSALPTSALNKNFVVSSFKKRVVGTYTDDYNTAKANAPAGCEHYNEYVDQYPLIFHHGIKPYQLMHQSGTSWVQDSFTTSDPVFHATASPQNFIVPSTEDSNVYDTDITFSLPEYSGLTFVEYVWNIRQLESGLTLKATIRQNKKTGTVHFNDGNTIRLKGIGSYGSKGVIPSKGITYTGDYRDNVNDTISWYNSTNGLSPATGNFTDEDHANSTGLNDNITITSDQSWCHDIRYNITGWTAYVDWWKDGEGRGSRTANITMTKKDPRLDVVEPDSFQIIQDAPVPKPCYHFSGLSANNLSCYGGSVNATVQESIKKIYHDYSPCADNVSEEYYVRTEQVGWDYSPKSIGMNTDCHTKTHTITATQAESGLQLTTTITQSYDCDHQDYINNCYASPSSVGSGGGTVTIYANARYYDKTCTVNYDNSSYSPTTYYIPANNTQTGKSYSIPVSNAGSATCYVTVTQDGQPAPAGCNNNAGYSISASISSHSVSCDGGSVTVNVDTCKSDDGGDVSWTVNPGGHTGTGSGSATVDIPATDEDYTTTVTLTSDAGSCSWDVNQTDCGEDPGPGPGPTGGTGDESCELEVHTPNNNENLQYTELDWKMYVCISGYYTDDDTCDPVPWSAETNCNWLHITRMTGTDGYCCSAYDRNSVNATKRDCANDDHCIFLHSDENPYNEARDCTLRIYQRGANGCNTTRNVSIHQQANPNGGDPGGGGGDCSCCDVRIHTDMGINNLDCSARTIKFYIVYACDNCVAKNWEIRPDSGSWPNWISWSKTSGSGRCNDDLYDCDRRNSQEIIDAGKAEEITCTITRNETGASRRVDFSFYLLNASCSKGDSTYIQQASCDPAPSGCTDCYVLFQNSRQVTAEASGLTLSNEKIVEHGTGDNCECDVKNFTISPDNIGVTVTPSSGDMNSCTIKVPENTSTSQRTITITIHPHDGEKSTANCK